MPLPQLIAAVVGELALGALRHIRLNSRSKKEERQRQKRERVSTLDVIDTTVTVIREVQSIRRDNWEVRQKKMLHCARGQS